MLIAIVIVAALFGLLFGFDQGVISGALPFIKQDFVVTPFMEGVITSAVPLGAVAGTIVAMVTTDKYGRKPMLVLGAIIFFVGSLASALAFDQYILTLSRLLIGVGIGASAMTAPMFLAEVAPARIRGTIVSAFQLMITIGIMVSYMSNAAFGASGDWRWMIGVGVFPAIIAFVGILLSPETPRWLTLNKNADKARDIIAHLQPEATDADLDRIIHEIKESAHEEDAKPAWSTFLKKGILPVTSFAMIVFVLQQLSGINAIIYYAPEIFKQAGFSGQMTQLLATVGVGVVNVALTIVAMYLVESIGRRKLLILGFVGTSISMAVVTGATMAAIPASPYIALFGIFAFIAFFAVSLGPLPWLYMSELFPLRLRPRGMALASVANWFFNFIVALLFPVLLSGIGIVGTFGIFTICCVAGIIYAIAVAPETKGVSLEEIEQRMVMES
ncbi:sugar porter (SP) family MFS transporter [Martelella mediterranea]|uniref:Sugar porter (SP) family MFS transporter n=1 Tax=Martelella mediterranea TaxID=293089 RepID=A0A4R3NUR0_9HYPH|nr:sugar porter family MFS transporter [Martelella mediterranea]TCT41107.1 sugar porter (SP) family MFS transporter [Martelella mediterranea]